MRIPVGRPPRDHPRIRGEHHSSLPFFGCGAGSSPHTRGAQLGGQPGALGEGIIPAYAGSTQDRSDVPHLTPDHPRIRGEHASKRHSNYRNPGSSPHTRGAPRNVSHATPSPRIIPAYAGSTRCAASSIGEVRDHPRIRGEHIQDTPLTNVTPGSSPHTRGARPAARPSGGLHGIIPAYAGSTSR